MIKSVKTSPNHSVEKYTKTLSPLSLQIVEKCKILCQRKIFRQINSLVICLEKTLLSRNFCQKVQ